MKRIHILALALVVTAGGVFLSKYDLSQEALRVSVASLDTDRIVNIHESVEDDGDIAKLQVAMGDVGIDQTVLHGIPYDLLHYKGQELIRYSALDENHAFLKEVSDNDPEHFSFLCAVDPGDLNRMGEVQKCMDDGGLGVKIYDGYTYGHEYSLMDTKLTKVYDMVDELGGILMLPVNTSKYENELVEVLTTYPNIKIICPHYCLSSKNLPRLAELLDTYPNLYTDTSFGHQEFMLQGFETMTLHNEEFRNFFEKYQDRIMFGTDTVVTGYENKEREWLGNMYHDYLSMLSADTFTSKTDPSKEFKGLDLSPAIQKKVFWQNWHNLIK
ncbi:amidohydrolase [Patescibacteria group bacterium]|nr:amidohydrolase [Patescibacteria group bacterium]